MQQGWNFISILAAYSIQPYMQTEEKSKPRDIILLLQSLLYPQSPKVISSCNIDLLYLNLILDDY
jgi:hypothetical protein